MAYGVPMMTGHGEPMAADVAGFDARRRQRWGAHVHRLIEFRRRLGWRGDSVRLAAGWAVRGKGLRALAQGGIRAHRLRLDGLLAAAFRRAALHNSEVEETSLEGGATEPAGALHLTVWEPCVIPVPILDVTTNIAAPRPGPLAGAIASGTSTS